VQRCLEQCLLSMADNHEVLAGSSTSGQETMDTGDVDFHNIFPEDSPWSTSHNPHYSDAIEVALDAQNVNDDMLASCSELEKKVLMSISNRTVATVAAHIREAVLHFMSHLMQLMNMPPCTWFQLVTLFDIYCLSMPTGPSVGQLPATCIALVKLLTKMDCTAACTSLADLSPLGLDMRKWLEGLGHTVPFVTQHSITKVEWSLLQVLNWQLDVPTVESWMSMFCARFNVLTQSAFIDSLNWIWDQSICYARAILLQQASNPAHPPFQMAIGLLALGCVSARLLPVASIRSLEVSAQTWDQSFAEIQPHGTIPECLLSPAQSEQVLQLLQVSTGAGLEEIQEACRALVPCMKEAYVNILQRRIDSTRNSTSNPTSRVHHSVI